jgi:hypothetical protein
MFPASHLASYEAVITEACSDRNFKHSSLHKNPMVRIEDTAKALSGRMLPANCYIDQFYMQMNVLEEFLVAFDPAGNIAGGVCRKQLLVFPDYRGRGLGSEILIQAFETGVMHPATMNIGNKLTTAGRANRRAAHRIAIERAMEMGITVRGDVLNDYPDLQQRRASPTHRSL